MRLNTEHLEAIQGIFKTLFLEGDELWLFGSRVDDSKKGGDIDLYIETSLPTNDALDLKDKFVIALWRRIGEQTIDVVMNVRSTPTNLDIYTVARTEGKKLV